MSLPPPEEFSSGLGGGRRYTASVRRPAPLNLSRSSLSQASSESKSALADILALAARVRLVADPVPVHQATLEWLRRTERRQRHRMHALPLWDMFHLKDQLAGYLVQK